MACRLLTWRSRASCFRYRRCINAIKPVEHRHSLRAISVKAKSSDGVLERLAVAQERAASRPHRFYVTPGSPLSSTVLEGDEGKHAVRALRLKGGDVVELCDGKGNTVIATITAVEKGSNRAWVEASSAPVYQPWQGPRWMLAVGCTTLKGGRAEWLVEKAAEIGAAELIPIMTARSRPQGASGNKYKSSKSGSPQDEGGDYQPGRLERVAIAATKQCLRPHALVLHPPTWIDDIIPQVQASTLSLVAAAEAPPLREVLGSQQLLPAGSLVEPAARPTASSDSPPAVEQLSEKRSRVEDVRLLIVGPEGDFTPEELRQLVAAGAQPVGLGQNRLRTETAAIALLSAVHLWTSEA